MGGQADEARQVVTVDDVTVEKHLIRDHPLHVAVTFDIRSDRQDSVRLRLRDPVPDQFTVGFHPDFGGEQWSRADQGVEFERVLEAGETYRTAYAVDNVSQTEVAQLSEAPSIELSSRNEEARYQGVGLDPGEGAEAVGGPWDLDLDLPMEAGDGFDLGDSVFDDQATEAPTTDRPAIGDENASEPTESGSGSIMEEGFQEGKAEFFEGAFEQDATMEAQSSPGAGGNQGQPTDTGLEPTESEFEFSNDPVDKHTQSLEAGETVGQAPPGAEPTSTKWISASLKETIEELEATTAELAESTSGRRTKMDELQHQLDAVRDELDGIEGSLETVEDQSTYLASVFEDLEDSIRTLQSTIANQAPTAGADASEHHAKIPDIAEEVSLIKSSLASNLETASQHRTDLNDVRSEIEQTSDTVETIGQRTQSITNELVGLRELLRANAESVEAVESNQLALQNAVNAMHEQLEELHDRVDDIAESVDTS